MMPTLVGRSSRSLLAAWRAMHHSISIFGLGGWQSNNTSLVRYPGTLSLAGMLGVVYLHVLLLLNIRRHKLPGHQKQAPVASCFAARSS
jgi:hypothetical protein